MMLHVLLSFKLIISSSEAGPVPTGPDRFTESLKQDYNVSILASVLFQKKKTSASTSCP